MNLKDIFKKRKQRDESGLKIMPSIKNDIYYANTINPVDDATLVDTFNDHDDNIKFGSVYFPLEKFGQNNLELLVDAGTQRGYKPSIQNMDNRKFLLLQKLDENPERELGTL